MCEIGLGGGAREGGAGKAVIRASALPVAVVSGSPTRNTMAAQVHLNCPLMSISPLHCELPENLDYVVFIVLVQESSWYIGQ